jgi:hypothetical protein
MDSYTPSPENMRASDHLSPGDIRKGLQELSDKIRTLQARANATTADSTHHYHEHIAALETKRAKLAAKLGESDDHASSTWQDVRNGIDQIKEEIKGLFGKEN